MIDMKTLEAIKEKEYLKDKDFSSELHKLIHSFYSNFDLDRQSDEYRKLYITKFVADNEAFFVNYETNVFNPNLRTTDKLSDELTMNKFLDTLSLYLTKYYEDGKDEDHDDYE